MEGSRDGNNTLHHSEDLDDDSGLELSLGLSWGGSRHKSKVTKNTPLSDGISDTEACTEGDGGKARNGRASGLDSALKRFLQGCPEEQEKMGMAFDEYKNNQGSWVNFSGCLSKDQETSSGCQSASSLARLPSITNLTAFPSSHVGPRFQEKAVPLELPAGLEGKGDPSILKDLHLPPNMAAAAAAAWGHFGPQVMPVNLMDGFRNGPGQVLPPGTSILTASPLLPHFLDTPQSTSGQESHAGDDLSQDMRQIDVDSGEQLEQQRKSQEARKKRKCLIEEQKNQKKTKKDDDRTGSHGFRRPGSNTWVHGLEAPTPFLEGGKPHDDGTNQNSTTTSDASAQGNHHLYRAASLNCTQDPAAAFSHLRQVADGQLHSSFSVPPTSQFGQCHTLPDPGEIHAFKKQGGMAVFPGFAASVQAGQGAHNARPFQHNSDEGGVRQEYSRYPSKVEVPQQGGRVDNPSNMSAGIMWRQEDLGATVGGPFQKGSTENLLALDGLAPELLNLRPGIPAGFKFGGTGSSPDLPWVSTTGPGPNGKTICGVLYRFERNQVKIVCACHGRHMLPGEFLQHAGGLDTPNPEKTVVVNSFPLSSQSASAQG